MDLKYLTIEDLEKLKTNIELENKYMSGFDISFNRFQQSKFDDNNKLIRQIESEILERTLLGYKSPDGVSN